MTAGAAASTSGAAATSSGFAASINLNLLPLRSTSPSSTKPRMMAAEASVNGAKDQIERIATTFQEFQKQVADIRADVKVHTVLIASLEGLKTDIKDLRQDLSLTNERIRTPYKQP